MVITPPMQTATLVVLEVWLVAKDSLGNREACLAGKDSLANREECLAGKDSLPPLVVWPGAWRDKEVKASSAKLRRWAKVTSRMAKLTSTKEEEIRLRSATAMVTIPPMQTVTLVVLEVWLAGKDSLAIRQEWLAGKDSLVNQELWPGKERLTAIREVCLAAKGRLEGLALFPADNLGHLEWRAAQITNSAKLLKWGATRQVTTLMAVPTTPQVSTTRQVTTLMAVPTTRHTRAVYVKKATCECINI